MFWRFNFTGVQADDQVVSGHVYARDSEHAAERIKDLGVIEWVDRDYSREIENFCLSYWPLIKKAHAKDQVGLVNGLLLLTISDLTEEE